MQPYLDRARVVAPSIPEVWYLSGVQDLIDGHADRCWKNWHRCLELSDQYLPDIVDKSSELLQPQEMLDKLCPPQPGILLAMATRLSARANLGPTRQALLRKALVLLEGQAGTKAIADLHMVAFAQRSLGMDSEAVSAYQILLARDPNRWNGGTNLPRSCMKKGTCKKRIVSYC